MKLSDKIYLKKLQFLVNEAILNGDAMPIEDEVYKKLRDVYHGSTPANIYIKFMVPTKGSVGYCYEKSLVISSIFDDAKLVRGNRKDYEINYGPKSYHWWVEHDGWCYDPATLYKIKKETYYKLFKPKNLIELSKEKIVKEWYYKEMVRRAPLEVFFISNLMLLEDLVCVMDDEELNHEFDLFRKKINYIDSWDEEKILEAVKKMNNN